LSFAILDECTRVEEGAKDEMLGEEGRESRR